MPHDNDAAVLWRPCARRDPLPGQRAKRTLLFFLMESWSAEPLLCHGPKFDVLGRLAPTMPTGLPFSQFRLTQPGTHPSLRSHPVLLAAHAADPGRHRAQTHPWSIPKGDARGRLPHAVRHLPARSGWRDLNRVLAVQGFDEVIDANNLKADYPRADPGHLGRGDNYVFRYLEKRLAAQGKDQAAVRVRAQFHQPPPHDLPADYQRVPRQACGRAETSSDTLLPNLDSFHYATDLLGALCSAVQKARCTPTPWWPPAGDHNVRSFGVYAADRRYLAAPGAVRGLGRGRALRNQLDQPASHRDMFDTLFPWSGHGWPHHPAGRNLLRTPTDSTAGARALFFTGEARNRQGLWQLGQPGSFACSSRNRQCPATMLCQFNARDDQQGACRLACWTGRCVCP